MSREGATLATWWGTPRSSEWAQHEPKLQSKELAAVTLRQRGRALPCPNAFEVLAGVLGTGRRGRRHSGVEALVEGAHSRCLVGLLWCHIYIYIQTQCLSQRGATIAMAGSLTRASNAAVARFTVGAKTKEFV